MKSAEFNNELLTEYISFLYQNNLGELTNFYLLKNLEEIPYYLHLDTKELSDSIEREINIYLTSIKSGSIVEEIHSWIADSCEDKLSWLLPGKNAPFYTLSIIRNRKLCLLQFLSLYKQNTALILSLTKEIEDLSALQENLFLKQYTIEQSKLKKNLSQVRQILAHTPVHINIYDLETDQAIYNNGAGEKLFGHTSEDVISSKFSDLWVGLTHENDKEKVRKRIENFKNLKDNEIDHLEYRLKDKHGHLVWYYSKATIFKKEDGKVKQVLLNGLNISELKKAEEERNFIESQLKEAQKLAHIGSYDWDIVNDVLKYTDEAYRIYDLPRDKKQFKAEVFKERLKPEQIKLFEKNLKHIFNNSHSLYEDEYQIVLPDGTEKDIVSRAKIIRDSQGKPLRMLGTVMDITSIKKAEHKLREKNKEIVMINEKLEESQEEIKTFNSDLEELIKIRTQELKESEQRYKFIVENLPYLFWTALPNGHIDFNNKNVLAYIGSTPDSLEGWSWQPYVHPDDLSIVLDKWSESLKTKKPIVTEFRLKRYDGIYKWHLARIVPLKDNEGNVIKWMGSSIDIDKQKKSEVELRQKNEQLTRTNKDLDNFIYTASHDLRAPISNIEGLLSSLSGELDENTKSTDDVGIILNMMNSSVKKFKNTILDLTEITKAQKSGEEAIQRVDVKEILDDVKSMVEDLIKTTQADIETDFSQCSVINFSKKNLKSILYNLVSNAIKFRSPHRKPEIHIQTKCTKEYVELLVKDNGQGFDSSQKTKIFEMFKRLKSDTEGSGVGLYLVKRIITNAGGKIEAESKPGLGATFKVYFPSKSQH